VIVKVGRPLRDAAVRVFVSDALVQPALPALDLDLLEQPLVDHVPERFERPRRRRPRERRHELSGLEQQQQARDVHGPVGQLVVVKRHLAERVQPHEHFPPLFRRHVLRKRFRQLTVAREMLFGLDAPVGQAPGRLRAFGLRVHRVPVVGDGAVVHRRPLGRVRVAHFQSRLAAALRVRRRNCSYVLRRPGVRPAHCGDDLLRLNYNIGLHSFIGNSCRLYIAVSKFF